MNGSFLWILLKKGGISILLNIFDRARSRNDDYIIKNGVIIIKNPIILSKTGDLLSKKRFYYQNAPHPWFQPRDQPKNDKFRRLLQLPAAIHATIYHPAIKKQQKKTTPQKRNRLSQFI